MCSLDSSYRTVKQKSIYFVLTNIQYGQSTILKYHILSNHMIMYIAYPGLHEKGLLSVPSLSIYPSVHNQLSEHFSGNQLYLEPVEESSCPVIKNKAEP